jgi:flavodoxin
MKVLIAYYSETGNTEKVAQAMSVALSGDHDVVLVPVSEVVVDRLDSYQLVLLGAAVHDADLARPLKRLLEALPMHPSFKLAGFSTHAVYLPDGSAHREELHAQWAGKCLPTLEQTCQEKGIELLGYFHCQGIPSKPIEAFIHREIITDDDEWSEYLPEIQKHPTPEDLQNAKDFARKIIEKL